MPIRDHIRGAVALIAIFMGFIVAGSIDFARALEQEAQDKLDRARRIEQGVLEPDFFLYGPMQCPLSKRADGHWLIYQGWMIEKSDDRRPTGACIYRKQT